MMHNREDHTESKLVGFENQDEEEIILEEKIITWFWIIINYPEIIRLRDFLRLLQLE